MNQLIRKRGVEKAANMREQFAAFLRLCNGALCLLAALYALPSYADDTRPSAHYRVAIDREYAP